jgi:hypothetical protein
VEFQNDTLPNGGVIMDFAENGAALLTQEPDGTLKISLTDALK